MLVAVVLTIACRPYWGSVDDHGLRPSAQLAVDTLPGLMAFSLGGMAILLAFSGDRFLKAIRQGGKDNSLFMKVVVNFFHFLFVQTMALCGAFLVMAYSKFDWLAGAAFFLMCYGVTSAIAASAMLLNIARIFNIAED